MTDGVQNGCLYNLYISSTRTTPEIEVWLCAIIDRMLSRGRKPPRLRLRRHFSRQTDPKESQIWWRIERCVIFISQNTRKHTSYRTGSLWARKQSWPTRLAQKETKALSVVFIVQSPSKLLCAKLSTHENNYTTVEASWVYLTLGNIPSMDIDNCIAWDWYLERLEFKLFLQAKVEIYAWAYIRGSRCARIGWTRPLLEFQN